MAFKHGITVTEITTGARTLSAVATAVIGLVAIASDANALTFRKAPRAALYWPTFPI